VSGVSKEQVLWFDIAMGDSFAMDMSECREELSMATTCQRDEKLRRREEVKDLLDEGSGIGLGVEAALHELVKELSASNILEHYIVVLTVLSNKRGKGEE